VFFGTARGTREYHERMRIVLGVIAGCALVACARGAGDGHGSDGGGDSDAPNPVTATLSIAPAASALVILNGVPQHATYTATLTWTDGTTRDVTADTQFGIDGNFGTFAANVLTINAAARTQVMGLYHDKTASADVTASALTVRIDPSLPPTIVDLFGGPADPSPRLQINYPPAGTVMPRNIDDFEVHWTDGNLNDAFEVSLTTDLHEVRLYVPGGNGLSTAGPMASWGAFQETEWVSSVSVAKSVVYQVRGANRDVPRGVSTAMQTVQLSNEKMDGGLYYWASTSVSGATGIFRYDMHDPAWPLVRPTAAEPFLTTTETNGRCVACHVLSRDGSKVAVTYEDTSTPGPGTFIDVPSFVKTKAVPPDVASWNFGTFTPDNTQFLSVEHGILVVRDVATQAVLATMTTTPPSAWVTQPDLSPDGKQLVYVRPALSGTDLDFKAGQIYVRSYVEATHTFGTEVQLLSDGTNNFFPSWSPDGNWIAFNKSNAGELAYDDNTTSVWVDQGRSLTGADRPHAGEPGPRTHQLGGALGAVPADRRPDQRADVLAHDVLEARFRRALAEHRPGPARPRREARPAVDDPVFSGASEPGAGSGRPGVPVAVSGPRQQQPDRAVDRARGLRAPVTPGSIRRPDLSERTRCPRPCWAGRS